MLHETFQELQSMIPHLRASVLMGYDGIPVIQNIFEEGLDLSELTLECATLLQSAQRMFEFYGFEELSVKTKQGFLTLVPLDHEYFVFVMLNKEGVLGKARYSVQKLVPALRSQL